MWRRRVGKEVMVRQQTTRIGLVAAAVASTLTLSSRVDAGNPTSLSVGLYADQGGFLIGPGEVAGYAVGETAHLVLIADYECAYFAEIRADLLATGDTDGATARNPVVGDWSLPLDNPTLEKIPHRFVFYSWDPGKLGRYFHFNGNLLETVGPTEGIHAQAKQRTESSLNIRVNQEMRSGGGFIYSWRRALTHVGLSKAAIAKVLDQEIAKLEANWTRDLVNHMSAYKSD